MNDSAIVYKVMDKGVKLWENGDGVKVVKRDA